MNSYKFEWLKPESRSDKRIILGMTEEFVQNAAESIIGRRLKNNELSYFENLLSEKLNTLVEGNGSLMARVLSEAILFSALEDVEFGNNPVDLIVK